jgi:hypothetical protein
VPATQSRYAPLKAGERPENPTLEFQISVIEDRSGDFAEFEDLRDGVMMVSDSATTLGAIRILEKHKLIKHLADPKIVTTLGRRASFAIGIERPMGLEDSPEAAELIRLDLRPRDAGQDEEGPRMLLELKPVIRVGKVRRGIDCGFLIREGQTAIVKTQHPTPEVGDEGPWPVYFVVTPEWVD